MGMTPKYKTPEEMQKVIDKYFKDCENKGLLPVVEMLAVALKLDQRTIINYENKEEFLPTIKNAKDIIKARKLEALINGHVGNTTGLIFDLKNNYGYSDRTEVIAKNTNVNIDKNSLDELSDEELKAITNGN